MLVLNYNLLSLTETDLVAVQEHLLRGEREKAVEVALDGKHFAMALLVASMCSRETYYAAAKTYADSALLTGSPLHTTAMLFCGQLQAPDVGASTSSFWGGDSDSLRRQWRSHLSAIISNRTVGWDRIAVSLGDRLLELGETTAAHVCYMVCGCSVSPPVQQGSKMTLIGCDVSPEDVMLMTDVSIMSFAITEAFEWAKRRGNRNAAIQALQAFKLRYAMHLCDFGLVESAKEYVKVIMQRMPEDLGEKAEQTELPPFVSILSSDQKSLQSLSIEFRRRLTNRGTDLSKYWESSKADEADLDMTFVTAKSSADEVPSMPAPPGTITAISKHSKAGRDKEQVKARVTKRGKPQAIAVSPVSEKTVSDSEPTGAIPQVLAMPARPHGEEKKSEKRPSSMSSVAPLPSEAAHAESKVTDKISGITSQPSSSKSIPHIVTERSSDKETTIPATPNRVDSTRQKAPVSAPANLQSNAPSSSPKSK